MSNRWVLGKAAETPQCPHDAARIETAASVVRERGH